jgi:hypothetical protein
VDEELLGSGLHVELQAEQDKSVKVAVGTHVYWSVSRIFGVLDLLGGDAPRSRVVVKEDAVELAQLREGFLHGPKRYN